MMDPKLKMDVPPQVREFAQKSVDQAEKAISSFMDSASKSVATVPGPMTDVAKHALAILGWIIGPRSPHRKIPFPATGFRDGTDQPVLRDRLQKMRASSSFRIYRGFNPRVSNCRLHSAGASRSRSTPMPRGKRPSTAALTRSGARNASEMVMLT